MLYKAIFLSPNSGHDVSQNYVGAQLEKGQWAHSPDKNGIMMQFETYIIKTFRQN